jgi:hypothetical protein
MNFKSNLSINKNPGKKILHVREAICEIADVFGRVAIDKIAHLIRPF